MGKSKGKALKPAEARVVIFEMASEIFKDYRTLVEYWRNIIEADKNEYSSFALLYSYVFEPYVKKQEPTKQLIESAMSTFKDKVSMV